MHNPERLCPNVEMPFRLNLREVLESRVGLQFCISILP